MTGAADARVTVGMPVLDNGRTLARAIASVQAQTMTGWRLILSDDGSADDSLRIAEAAAAADPRIRLLRQPRRLGFMNFRAPLDLAETPFFVWLAGDDHWHPDFLTRTLTALEAAPAAISALPQAGFIGPPARPVPNLAFLRGDPAERVRRYLAHPGGTRMYGLMRTAAVRAVFPPRPFNAWDWYLMVSLLAAGPQLSLPEVLLYREETPWRRYAEVVDQQTDRWLYRRLPVLEMSLHLIRDRRIPRGALPALLALNLRKHEEYVAVNQPEAFRRRQWLYRGLGLPKAKAAQVARPAAPRPTPAQPVTAILTFRNAARTLPAALDHLEALGCGIIAVDHGSTDDSRAIASGKAGQIVDMPWTGVFDLRAQLELKRDLIASQGAPWVLHADADEFLDLPEGQSLAGLVAAAGQGGRIAFPVEEQLFTPRHEDEEHDPDGFLRTMTAFVRMREHNPKQRLFRADADLGLWMRTGGHSVTMDPALLAAPTLRLRHYPGLSLDDLRGQYLARVFAPRDRARLWHGNRLTSGYRDVIAPAPSLFSGAAPATLRQLPFFGPRAVPPLVLPTDTADTYLLGDATPGMWALIGLALPGLRLLPLRPEALARITRPLPVLHVLRHPATLHAPGVRRSEERALASDWTRGIAAARQWAVDRNAAYAEIRAEDAEADPATLRATLLRLNRGPGLRGTAGFLLYPGKIARSPYEAPVRSITGPLAADLGYV